MRTDADHTCRGVRSNGGRTVSPSCWQRGRLGTHAVRVIAEGLVKRGSLADGAIDQIARMLVSRSVEIELFGHGDLIGRIGHSTEDGLTADDHPLVAAGDRSRGPEDVLHLIAVHPRRAS